MTKRERNKLLQQAYELLQQAYDLIDEVSNDETDSLYNWPESLQETERYERAEERSDAIADLLSNVEENRDTLEGILNDDF